MSRGIREPPAGVGALSAREKEILAMYPEEPETKAIAHRLGISIQTVKNHITSLLVKLGVYRMGQAAVLYDRSLRGEWSERRVAERRRGERRRT